MGRACGTHGGEESCIHSFSVKPEGRSPLERWRIDGRVILKCIFECLDGGIDWIDLAQDRDR
jgi:hypothetical protein